jgi:hypothetical protein
MFKSIGVAIVAFAAIVALFRVALPPPRSQLTPKLDRFRQSADHYTTVFVGASVVYRHIDPMLFDTELRRAAIPSRSFNLGAPAMTFGEAEYWVRKVLSWHPARLKYLIIDATLVQLEATENLLSARFIAWHDLPATRLSIATTLASSHPLATRSKFVVGDVRALLYNATAVGAVSQTWTETEDYLVGNEGFAPLGLLGSPQELERQARLRTHLNRYLRRVNELRTSEPDYPDEDRRMLSLIVDECRSHGVTPIVISAPVLWNSRIDVNAPVFDFRDPDRYPELYDLAFRFDEEHLNAQGAQLYTSLVAKRFIEWANAVR